MPSDSPVIDQIVNFLQEIHINVIESELADTTFLPGIDIRGNTILVDKVKLKYPGDLLHEAGHIAVTEEAKRALIGSKELEGKWPTDGEEIVAMLWSYAALLHIGIDIKIVFHPDGYKNQSDWLIEQFTNKVYIGLPLLEWMGLCNSSEFPKMKKWLR